jgi:hypothetical protein
MVPDGNATAPKAPVTVWRGNYQFGRRGPFFDRAVRAARAYADRDLESRPRDVPFHKELECFRAIAPVNGQGLLDQLEHRWRHPDCLPAVYAMTCTLSVPPNWGLVAESGELVRELTCVKIGKAKRCVVARITTYNTEPINGVWPVEGSQKLRLLIYGDGPRMLSEASIKEVARRSGSYARVIDETGYQRNVSPEVFVGGRVIDAICAFARERIRT